MEFFDQYKKEIQKLIVEGEKLVPVGGSSYGGYNSMAQHEYVSWRLRVFSIFQEIGDPAKYLLADLEKDTQGQYFYKSSAARILGALKAAEGIIERKAITSPIKISKSALTNKEGLFNQNQVFVVHGRETSLREQVARLIESLDLKPIILSEEPGKGKTIIEKIEANSSVGYAIVLFTPDDVGAFAQDKNKLNPRARQNVVLELGYFLGGLGRPNVAVLYDKSVEMPSDYHGVEYIEIDVKGAWKLRLAKEMKAAGLKIDMNKLV